MGRLNRECKGFGMTKNAQRESQLITTFGPGAMLDLPTRSVLIGGLERWNMRHRFEPIHEERLTALLQARLVETQRLSADVTLTLRRAPTASGAPGETPPGVEVTVFPTWFACDTTETANVDGREVRRRRLVRWQDLDAASGRRKFSGDGGKPSDVTPIRFVAACNKGHIDDIDWRGVVHAGAKCEESMWLEDRGTSADPRDTLVRCGCGKSLSLEEAFRPGRLGMCRGHRPWLGRREDADEKCDLYLRFLTRTATNTYFSQVATVISLPSAEDALTKLVQTYLGDLAGAESATEIKTFKKGNAQLREALAGYADEEVFARVRQVLDQSKSEATIPVKVAEFDVFASGRKLIGTAASNSRLHAETIARAAWDRNVGVDLSGIKNLVAVHRLREVSCLYGFTRFEAAPTSADGELEDIHLAVDGAPISLSADWLPAVEQFGEGIFIHFDEARIQGWLREDAVQQRVLALADGHEAWARGRFQGKQPQFPGGAYVFLHSLAHALMTEIALDCGYPASSLKERVYALGEERAAGLPQRCGILIYTASTGALGTLGGLVATVPRFAQALRSALLRLELCSNDPVCADHAPMDSNDDRSLHGAACHGCLLIAETSCEVRNVHLDRALVAETLSGSNAAFFGRVET